MLRRLALFLSVQAFLLITPNPLPGQKPAAEPSSTFTTRADLVLVPVHVRRHGEHVSGLSKEAFTVLEDGQQQKVAVFEEVRTTTQRLQRATVPQGEFTNELQGKPETARYTVIAIDRINTTTMDMNRLRLGLMKFLSEAADSGEPIRLVAINPTSIDIIQDFTTDPHVLAAALKKASTPAGREQAGDHSLDDTIREMDVAAASETDDAVAEQLSRALDTQKEQQQRQIAFRDRLSRLSSLEALQQLALSLAGLPGRKSLVWASSGYPFTSITEEYRDSRNMVMPSGVRPNFNGVAEAAGLDEYTTHLLSTGNIAMYPVDARGTVNTAYEVMDPSRKYSPTMAEKQYAQGHNQDIITTFEHLAAATGGKACFERADLSGCFKDALEDSRDYYLLGYYINRQKLQPGWHKINVKVAGGGVSVRSRTGFLLPKFGPDQTRSLDLNLGLGSRLLDPGIPFRGRWLDAVPSGDKKALSVLLHIPSSAALVAAGEPQINFDVVAVARKPDGSVAGQFSQHVDRRLDAAAVEVIQKQGISYKNVLELPTGIYSVRFVIRDNLSGRMGSVSTIRKVE